MTDPLGPHRTKLFGIAYRMLGSVADAEDVLQDAWIRAQKHDDIDDPGAWLATTVTRLCIDRLTSARARREEYVGPWLPEPLVTHEPVDRESISMAFLTMLERLNPTERAVFLLRQVFDFDHGEIARSLGMSEAAVRQTFHRAKEHIDSQRVRFAPNRETHARLLSGFVAAVTMGDLASLTSLLAEDAIAVTDSGGQARAARNVLRGADAVGRFFIGIAKKPDAMNVEVSLREANGWPAVVLRKDGQVTSVTTIETDGERIYAIRVIANPDKLTRFEDFA